MDSKAKRTIFVCDDESEFRVGIRSLLSQLGYEVREMANGQELLTAVMWERPDAILLDLFMPEMNGWETLARLKDDPETADIPIIIVSILAPEEVGVLSADLSGWFQKPFNQHSLVAAVDRAVAA